MLKLSVFNGDWVQVWVFTTYN